MPPKICPPRLRRPPGSEPPPDQGALDLARLAIEHAERIARLEKADELAALAAANRRTWAVGIVVALIGVASALLVYWLDRRH